MEQASKLERTGRRDEEGSPLASAVPLSRRTFLRRAVFGAGGLLAARLGTGSGLAVALGSASKPNIILLTADSLRADHMGAYGYPRPTTPHLDRLAAESVCFEHAFAPASYTGPSLASLHTGKYPQEHFMHFANGNAPYRHTDPALAALLQAHGYQTAAFVSNHVLERRRSQMDKGFAAYDDTLPEQRDEVVAIIARRTAPQTTAAVLQWLKTRAKPPFFLWVHYIEPHGPYAPPPPYDTMFFNDALYQAEPRLLELSPEQLTGGRVARVARVQGRTVTPRMVTYLDAERIAGRKVRRYNPRVADHIARYDGEIRALDEAVGPLLQALKTLGLYDTSWLVFTSDHGESLGERGFYFQHGWRVTLELLHIPLFIKPPGTPTPRKVDTQVNLIDLLPTLLEAVGVKPPAGLSGQSILPLLRGEQPKTPRLVFSELAFQYSLIDGQYQLLVGYDDPTFKEKEKEKESKPAPMQFVLKFGAVPISLFAYRRDPVGEKDLVDEDRANAEKRLGQFRAFLENYLRRTSRVTHLRRPPIKETAKTREILKQLGY